MRLQVGIALVVSLACAFSIYAEPRIMHKGEGMPDGVMFMIAGELTKSAPDLIPDMLAEHGDIDHESAEAILSYLQNVIERADREIFQAQKDLGCRLTLSDEAVTRAHDGFDDLEASIYTKYHGIAKAEMESNEFEAFQRFLTRLKRTSGWTVPSHSKFDATTLRSRLQVFCSQEFEDIERNTIRTRIDR